MDLLTKEASQKSGPRTLKGSGSVTSSQESEAGPSPSSSQDGQGTGPYGLGLAHASPSAWREKEREAQTSGTCGPKCAASSRSAALQSSLANRLQARLGVNGSMEYALTWKTWDMQSGPPICALRGSTRRTSAKDSGGWPTPRAQEPGSTSEGYGKGLQVVARTAGWGTPRVTNNGGIPCPDKTGKGSRLEDQAALAGWPTPRAADGDKGTRSDEGAYREANRRKCGLEHADSQRLQGWEKCDQQTNGPEQQPPSRPDFSGPGDNFWSDFELIPCSDGKARRIEPGLAPLVDGLPGRVGLLRGYGNAIVPQVAAEFILAYYESV